MGVFFLLKLTWLYSTATKKNIFLGSAFRFHYVIISSIPISHWMWRIESDCKCKTINSFWINTWPSMDKFIARLFAFFHGREVGKKCSEIDWSIGVQKSIHYDFERNSKDELRRNSEQWTVKWWNIDSAIQLWYIRWLGLGRKIL